MNKKPLYLVFILIVISLIPIVYSISASASVPRAVLEANVDEGDTEVLTKILTYPNVNDFDVFVTFSLGGDLVYIGELDKDVLEIEADESEDVELTMILNQPGLYEGNVCAAFSETDGGSGIATCSQIIISAFGEGDMWESPDDEYVDDEDDEYVVPDVGDADDEDEDVGTMNVGGFDNKDDDDKKTSSSSKSTKNDSKKVNDGPDFIEKYFQGNILAFFIVFILMLLIGLEIFYIIYKILKR